MIRPSSHGTGSAVERRGAARLVAALFLAGLLPRAAHWLTVGDSPHATMLILDPLMYDEWGWAIAGGQGGGSGVYFQDPLYAYVLAAVYSLVGRVHPVVTALQSLLGALVGPLLFVAARGSFSRGTAVLAGLLAALYAPAIYYDGLILKTSTGVFLVALWLALSARASRRGGPASWAAAGVVLGLACLNRGNLLLLVPVAAAWTLVEGDPAQGTEGTLRSRLGDARPWAAAGALALGAALVVAPATLRNRFVGGEWVLTTANAGQNFYIGNNPLNETGEYQRLPWVDPNPKFEQRDFAREAARLAGHPLGARETSSFWFSRARRWIVEHPADWMGLLGLKLRAYWAAFEIPDNLDYALYREHAPVLRLPLPGFGLLAPFGLLGLVACCGRRGWPRLLVLTVLVYSLSVVLFFVFSRFRMAMVPALCVLAAHGAVRVASAGRTLLRGPGSRLRAAATLGGLAALLAAVNLPVRAHEGSRALALARALRLPLRVESSATARFNLGVAYAARAAQEADPVPWLALAEAELRRALTEERRYASVPVELGKVLARQGRIEEAIELHRRALQLEPDDWRTHHALAILERRRGDLEAARGGFARALALEPRSTASALELGDALLELGRPVEAAKAYRHALALAPASERAAAGLRAAEVATGGASGPPAP